MFIGVIPSIAGMGGLAGAVAEAGNSMFPFLSIEIWVGVSCLITWLLLYLGSYRSLEKDITSNGIALLVYYHAHCYFYAVYRISS